MNGLIKSCINIAEYYLAVKKRNEESIHATTWINLENMLNEKSHKGHMVYDSVYVKCPEQASP